MTWTGTVRIVQGLRTKLGRDYCSLVDVALYRILAVMITII
jgi:hypothetical protein